MLKSLDQPAPRFPADFNFDAEREAASAGVLEGLTVQQADGSEFSIFLIDCKRLQKEIDSAQKSGNSFFARPGLIVVSRISSWIATMAIHWAASQDYFDRLKPIPYSNEPPTEVTVSYPDPFDMPAQHDAYDRGYLEDVSVCLNKASQYLVSFMTPTRLRQEIEADALNGRPFFVEPGLMVVTDIKQDLLTQAIHNLALEGYFNHLKVLSTCK